MEGAAFWKSALTQPVHVYGIVNIERIYAQFYVINIFYVDLGPPKIRILDSGESPAWIHVGNILALK